jgi:uncharacterized protein YcfJ
MQKDSKHSIGTGVGIGAGAVAGAAMGTAVAPLIGTLLGGAIGALAGGLAGSTIAEHVKPAEEEAYWRDQYTHEPYYKEGSEFDHYAPAYRLGYLGRVRYDGRSYGDIEETLADEYEKFRSEMPAPPWDDVRPATRAAWERTDERVRQATGN